MTCSTEVEIVNRKGLHARASAKLANLALTLPATITLSHEDETANARSIMDLLCLGASKGDTIRLRVEGPEEKAALEAILELIEDGFGELAEDAACCKPS
ncbi:MAG: HPr family phosphocarrier protein [Henriciella sp.]|nr:HPr family phosphocarrier protein [Henriciella sp.]